MPDESVIRITNASAVIEGHQVLHDINWQVKKGEHWFVLGANGCGKSTLMNLVMCYLWPRLGGSVEVLGKRYGRCVAQEQRKRIGWVSAFLQDWTKTKALVVNVVLSGFDGSIGLFREPTREEGQKVKALLNRLGCTHLALRQFGTLSSGEQMRILIARAMIGEPDLLVLDEPCCHLDLKSREYFLDAIRELAESPAAPTLIFVTHRVDDIIDVFSHGLIIKDGHTVAQGPRDEVLTEANLCEAFDVQLRLQSVQGRYWTYLQH